MISKNKFIENLLKRLKKTMEKELPEVASLDDMHEEFYKIFKGKFLLK